MAFHGKDVSSWGKVREKGKIVWEKGHKGYYSSVVARKGSRGGWGAKKGKKSTPEKNVKGERQLLFYHNKFRAGAVEGKKML